MFDPRAYRQMMSCFATGVAVVTARDAVLGDVGITVNSLTSVSLEPPLLLFCLDKKAHLHPVLVTVPFFAINILAEGQEAVSRHFAHHRQHAEQEGTWDKPHDDTPLLRHTLGWIHCRRTVVHDGGDHSILLGEVTAFHKRTSPHNPLLYFHSRYRTLGE